MDLLLVQWLDILLFNGKYNKCEEYMQNNRILVGMLVGGWVGIIVGTDVGLKDGSIVGSDDGTEVGLEVRAKKHWKIKKKIKKQSDIIHVR